MEPVKTIQEIEALVDGANLAPDELGEVCLLNAMSDLRIVRGRACGDRGFGHFLGVNNTNSSRLVHAYYEIGATINGPWQGNRRIGPGQTEWITCSNPAPGQQMWIHITGANYP